MTEPVLGPTSLPKFLVKQLQPKKHGLNEANLVQAVQEIETETTITGASMLRVHVIDPEWTIITSGLVKVNEDGMLNAAEVEYPPNTGYFWRLVAVEGSTEITAANLIMTFEDRVVAWLRERWGHKTAAPGTSTRAQFVRQLVIEANLIGKHNIRFVSPGVNRKEPVAEAPVAKTKAATLRQEAAENRERGIHAGAEFKIKGVAPSPMQRALANEVLRIANEKNAGPLATEALIEACIAENTFTNNPGGSGTSSGLLQVTAATAAGLGIDPLNVRQVVEGFLLKGYAIGEGAIAYARSHPNAAAYEVAQAIQGSGAGKASNGAANYGVRRLEAEEIIHAYGGVRTGGTTQPVTSESGVGQLSRGGAGANPDENSWQCMERLAHEVNWSVFTDGRNTLFYMDGPDLVNQRPVCYVNPVWRNPLTNEVTSHVIKEDKGGQKIEEYGVVLRPLVFTYDNVSMEYRATHKVKGRIQHKANVAKPNTPAEVRMNLLCGLSEYRAGDVFVFRNCGPISANGGRWIVANATRETMRYPYTKLLLSPPSEPYPEPKATAPIASGGEVGSAIVAFNAANTLSQMALPYLLGGGHGAGALANVKRGGEGLDCSSSTCWVLNQAGMYPSSTAQVSGELAASFGEPGKGKEMTVWANKDHVFIEFNIPGHERAQMNTNGPQNGPRLYTVTQTPTYNMSPETEGFTARHFRGT